MENLLMAEQINKGNPKKLPGSPIKLFRQLKRNALDIFKSSYTITGDISHINLGIKKIYLINHPEAAKRVLLDNRENYIKNVSFRLVADFLGDNLLTTNNWELWKKERAILAPSFHVKALEKICGSIVKEAKHSIDAIKTKDKIILNREILNLTLSVVTRLMFNFDTQQEQAEKVLKALDYFTIYFEQLALSPFSFIKILFPKSAEYKYHQQGLQEIGAKILRENKQDDNTFVNILLNSQDKVTGEKLSQDRLVSQILVFLLAGFETTANGLTWIFILLSQNPGVRIRLQQEIQSVLKGKLPTYENLSQLVYTKAVILETLRLYPPVPGIGRYAVEQDQEVHGYTIPKNSDVFINTYMIHRHPDFWSNPEGFFPERFLKDELPHKFAHIPFGAGPRICIGSSLAIMEMQLLLAIICQSMEFDLCPGQNLQPSLQLTLRPKEDIYALINTKGVEQI